MINENQRIYEGEIIAFTATFVFFCFRDITIQELMKDPKKEEALLRYLTKMEDKEESHLYIRTFNHFDVFVEGVPVVFRNPKAKEMLAILIDRAGGMIGNEEAISLLWEDAPMDESIKARYRKIAYDLRETLKEQGIADILIEKKETRGIQREQINCNYYDLLEGKEEAVKQFAGAYMTEYSWAEPTSAGLLALTDRE